MISLFSDIFSADNLQLTEPMVNLIVSLAVNSLVTWIIVHFFYYPKGHRRDYYFTFILLSVSIFMLISLLLQGSSDMGIGAALGLFAIFGIIRYRTESVPIREMTYLFFIGCVWLCENFLTNKSEGCKLVKYDNIDLIRPDRMDELKEDLEKRLGIKINRIEVGAVDFLTDMTMLRVFYHDPDKRIKSIDRMLKIPNP